MQAYRPPAPDRRSAGVLLALLLGALSGGAAAQASDPESTRAPEPARPEPLRLGSFIVSPNASLALGRTNNAQQDNTQYHDWRWDLGAGAHLQSDWSQHSLTANVDVNGRRYENHKTEDRDLFNAYVQGRYDLTPEWKLLAYLKLDESDMSKADPNRIPGISKAKTHTVTEAAQVQNEGPFLWGYLLVSHEEMTYKGTMQASGDPTTLVSALNRKRDDIAFFPGIKVGENKDRIFAILTSTHTNFEANTPDAQARNMDGTHAGVGYSTQTATTKAEVRVWRFDYQFADPSLGKLRGTQAYASGNWLLSPSFSLMAKASRMFEPNNIPGSPGYYANDIGIGVRWNFLGPWSLEGNLGRTRYLIERSPDHGTADVYGLALVRNLTPHLQGRLQFSRNKVDTTIPIMNYSENAVALQVVGRW